MPADAATINTIASFVALLVLGVVAVWVFFHRRRLADLAQLRTMQDQISSIALAHAVPINAAYQAMLAAELTHAHTPELDALLARAGPPSDLVPAEWERLRVMLVERYQTFDDDQVSGAERDAAFIFPFVVQRAQREYEAAQLAKNMILTP